MQLNGIQAVDCVFALFPNGCITPLLRLDYFKLVIGFQFQSATEELLNVELILFIVDTFQKRSSVNSIFGIL